ncbi:hypothetical protein ACFX16_029127 [Malus domestica]
MSKFSLVDVFPATGLSAVPSGIIISSRTMSSGSSRSSLASSETRALLIFGGGVIIAAGYTEHVDIRFVVVLLQNRSVTRPVETQTQTEAS